MQELALLRKNTLNITEKIISLFNERRPLVRKIQSLKNNQAKYKNFDPVREDILFKSLSELKNLSFKELLSISLLIESQAFGEDDYPQWSSGIHLTAKPNSITEQINPILLASTFKTSYDALPLNIEYKELLLSLFK